MYQIGDKVVHPMHGAGVIDSIVQRKVSGRVQEFYLLKLSVGNMVVMVPTDNTGEIGMRPVVSGAKAEELMSEMEGIEVDMTQNWNRRYRENMVRLKSGDLLEVARVVKGLLRRYQVYRGKPEAVQEEAEWCGLRVSLTGNMVWRNDRELDLTDTEWRILRLLVQNRGKIFSMENLYESVWRETYFPSSANTVMVHIRRLREKVEDDPRHPEYIKTVWGKGYRVG